MSFSAGCVSRAGAAVQAALHRHRPHAQRALELAQRRAQLEVDFIDFSKASPTVVSLPRLRIARVEWAPTPKFSVVAGQDWDLHAPVNAHGANLVGTRFLSGNTGFR